MVEKAAPQVTLNDKFWSPRLAVNARRAIFHQWKQLESSGCLDNFRILTGEKTGFRVGWFFADSDAYKWLDAAARIYSHAPDTRIAALMDDLIGLLGRAQAPDGYLFTYNQLHFPEVRWKNLQIEHELYCHGHLIEAGVSHFQATGRDEMMKLARKAADLLVREFLDAGPERTPGHEEIEIALIKLYQTSGQAAYLELARHFLEQRGRTPRFGISLLRQNSSVAERRKAIFEQRKAFEASHPGQVVASLPEGNYSKNPPFGRLRWYANALTGKYFQQHAPLRQQTVPVGHAVRFGYLQTATAMLLNHQEDAELLAALEQSWERMVTRRMYVTGGIGALPALEGFGRDYELDPEYAYAETCAALASIFWSWEMALQTGGAKYSDLVECQLYNAAAVGMGWNGESYLYNNPLTCRGGVTRKAWYAVPCCPSNLSRTWADLEKYVLSQSQGQVTVHQYISCQGQVELDETVNIKIESELPWQGKVKITISPAAPLDFTLSLRLPSWSRTPRVTVHCAGNTQPVAAEVPGTFQATAQGYDPRLSRFVHMQRTWREGDFLELELDMPVIIRQADPRVKGHAGKVALTRGPLVYCLESVDNPKLDIFSARLDAKTITEEHIPDLFEGVTVLRGKSVDGSILTFIPYALWANRGESQMVVWVNN
jgi:uncharacterized protein